jgi:hypothetical protein
MPTAPANVRQPQDRKPKNKTKADVLNEPITFTWDDEEWTVAPAQASSLEFLAALEDEEVVAACRHLLGREQAARLFRGRKVEDLERFFEAMGEELGSGNR